MIRPHNPKLPLSFNPDSNFSLLKFIDLIQQYHFLMTINIFFLLYHANNQSFHFFYLSFGVFPQNIAFSNIIQINRNTQISTVLLFLDLSRKLSHLNSCKAFYLLYHFESLDSILFITSRPEITLFVLLSSLFSFTLILV